MEDILSFSWIYRHSLLSNAVARANGEGLDGIPPIVFVPDIASPSLGDKFVGVCEVMGVVEHWPLPDTEDSLDHHGQRSSR